MVDLDYTVGGSRIGGGGIGGGGAATPIPDASTVQKGALLIATQAEAEAGTNNSKAITPATARIAIEKHLTTTLTTALKDASPTEKGLVEISDTAQNIAATDTTTAVSPAGVKEVVSQLSKRGLQPVAELFVDPNTGVDAPSTTGAANAPFKSLDYALKSANPEAKTIINLSAGVYPTPDGGFKIEDFVNLTIKLKAGLTNGQAQILIKLGTGNPTVSNGIVIRNCNEVYIKGLEFFCDPAITASGYVTPINTAWESANGYIEIADCIFYAVPGSPSSFANSCISVNRSRVILLGTITIRGSAAHFLYAGLASYVTNFANIVFENAPVFAGSFIRCEYNSLFRMNRPTTGAVTGRSYEARTDARVEIINNFPASMSAGVNETLLGVARGTATLDFPAIAANASASLSMTVQGVAVGDPVALGTPAPPAGITFSANVTAANSVTVTAFNRSAGSVDVPAGSFTVMAFKA